jgi:hypothetical protein
MFFVLITKTTVANFFLIKTIYEHIHTYHAGTGISQSSIAVEEGGEQNTAYVQSQFVEEIPVQRVPEAGRSAGGTVV